MSETSLGRYNKKPTMRVQKAEVSYHHRESRADRKNASKALQFIRDRGVKLTNIGMFELASFAHSQVPKISSMET
jgi:hypothetical protein